MTNHYVSLWQMRTVCQYPELIAYSSATPNKEQIVGIP